MQTILAELTVSMSDFKKNPVKILREAGTKPVAVLNHNKPAFYMVEPSVFEELTNRLGDVQFIRERLAQTPLAID